MLEILQGTPPLGFRRFSTDLLLRTQSSTAYPREPELSAYYTLYLRILVSFFT